MTPHELLTSAWTEAGYPPPSGPLIANLAKAAEAVLTCFEEGEEDFILAGFEEAGVDFPFAPAHPRYQAMVEAYRRLAQPQ